MYLVIFFQIAKLCMQKIIIYRRKGVDFYHYSQLGRTLALYRAIVVIIMPKPNEENKS